MKLYCKIKQTIVEAHGSCGYSPKCLYCVESTKYCKLEYEENIKDFCNVCYKKKDKFSDCRGNKI